MPQKTETRTSSHKEALNSPAKIKLLKDIDPIDLARRVNGKVSFKDGVVWDIELSPSHTLQWRGYPKDTKGVYGKLMLEDKIKGEGSTSESIALIISEDVVCLVNPGPDGFITGDFFSKQGHLDFKIPDTDHLESPELIKARNLAKKTANKLYRI